MQIASSILNLNLKKNKKRFRAIQHNSKCRYGERGAAAARPKAQIILDAAKVSAASGGNSEPKQGQRSQSARGFCPRSTMRVPQPDIIEHFGNADAVPQPSERCLSRKAGIVRCCLRTCSIELFNHGSQYMGNGNQIMVLSPFQQRLPCLIVRHHPGHGGPESRAVVGVGKVAKLVYHHILLRGQRHHTQPQGKTQRSCF